MWALSRTRHLGILIMSLNLLTEREGDPVICPKCGEHIDLFGAGEGPKAAGTSGLPVLARALEAGQEGA